MTRRRNPFPGVTRVVDRHGKVRWRFRRKGFSCYLPGAYGSAEWRTAYEAAQIEAKATTPTARWPYGSLGWLITHYLSSPRHAQKAPSTRKTLRAELDWLRRPKNEGGADAGDLPVARFRGRHVEALMAKKDGPAAQNRVRKNLSLLFNYAIRLELISVNPVRATDRVKHRSDGYHTWTDPEIDRFLKRHGTGTQARLALLLALNTGAAARTLRGLAGRTLRTDASSTSAARPASKQTCRFCQSWPKNWPRFLSPRCSFYRRGRAPPGPLRASGAGSRRRRYRPV